MLFNVNVLTVVILVALAPGPSTGITANAIFLKFIGKLAVTLVCTFPHCRIPEQWGRGIFRDENEKIFSLNIAFSSNGLIAVATDVGGGCYRLGITPKTKTIYMYGLFLKIMNL